MKKAFDLNIEDYKSIVISVLIPIIALGCLIIALTILTNLLSTTEEPVMPNTKTFLGAVKSVYQQPSTPDVIEAYERAQKLISFLNGIKILALIGTGVWITLKIHESDKKIIGNTFGQVLIVCGIVGGGVAVAATLIHILLYLFRTQIFTAVMTFLQIIIIAPGYGILVALGGEITIGVFYLLGNKSEHLGDNIQIEDNPINPDSNKEIYKKNNEGQ